jgi:hypothetical protein
LKKDASLDLNPEKWFKIFLKVKLILKIKFIN